jgi:hypothetical protein
MERPAYKCASEIDERYSAVGTLRSKQYECAMKNLEIVGLGVF